MTLKADWKKLLMGVGVFAGCFFLPVEWGRFQQAVLESLWLVKWYAREHVVLCLLPAFLIAGAMAVFVSQGAIMKYLGAGAKKVVAYGVASVAGSVLAVCSCTILPLFAGIHRMGAGLGPAVTFLYAGPAINVLAMILTARILGMELGIARAVGAIVFSIVIGLIMHGLYRREEREKAGQQVVMPSSEWAYPLWQIGVFFAVLIGILVFANWAAPPGVAAGVADGDSRGVWSWVWGHKWWLTGIGAVVLGGILVGSFHLRWWKPALTGAAVVIAAVVIPEGGLWALVPFGVGVMGLSLTLASSEGPPRQWWDASWEFAVQIMPLLFVGVLLAGGLLGRPDQEGLIPSEWVVKLVGGNSLGANLCASVAGAFMYFATLTEVPILQGLLGAGMGQGPALALLLAGPALSLPNMLVIRSVLGTQKTIVFVTLVIIMATVSGLIYGGIVA